MTDADATGRAGKSPPDRGGRWRPAVAVAGVVLAASLADPGSVGAATLPDAPLHVLGYAALGFALAYASPGMATIRRVALVVGGATAYGLAVELLQVPLPYRAFSRADVLANAAGATLSLAWLAVEPYVSG